MIHIVRKPASSSQHLKQLDQCASSPGHYRCYCYTKLVMDRTYWTQILISSC